MLNRTGAAVVAAALLVLLAVSAPALAGEIPGPGTNVGTVGGLTYMFRESPGTITPPGFRTDGPACPAGTHVVAGGVEVGGNVAESQIRSTFPADGKDSNFKPDDGWLASVWVGSGAPKPLDAIAVCRERKPLYRVAIHRVRKGKGRTVKAPCPSGTHVSGGGVFVASLVSGPDQAYVNSSYPFDGGDADVDPDDGWKARVYNIGGPQTEMRVYAICGAARPTYKVFDPTPLAPGVPYEAICPANRHIMGGGFRIGGVPAGNAHPVTAMPYDLPADADAIPDDELRVFAGTTGPGSATIALTAACR